MRPFRSFIPIICVVLGLLTAPSARAQAPVYPSERGPYRVVTVVDGLQDPWSIAFPPAPGTGPLACP